jgi:hypothetical protein
MIERQGVRCRSAGICPSGAQPESLQVPLAQNGSFTANGVTYVRQ